MVGQVEIRPGVNPFEFLEAEREPEFDVRCGICVMRQLLMVVKAVIVTSHPER